MSCAPSAPWTIITDGVGGQHADLHILGTRLGEDLELGLTLVINPVGTGMSAVSTGPAVVPSSTS